MIVFPHCKINLGLQILHKRPDGFHNLETVFYPIAIHDALEMLPAPALTDVSFTGTGIATGATPEQNLCVKAWHLLKKDFPALPPADIHLHKAIPVGAGLGGGSADGAFALRLLNSLYTLALTTDQLMQYAIKLGSDCPFFIQDAPCFATGRGEVLTPATFQLNDYSLLLINPGIHINTGWAFSQLQSPAHRHSVQEAIAAPVTTWVTLLRNDFEVPVFAAHPEIAALKTWLYAQGAVYASMSGSGSTVYGLFSKNSPPPVNEWPGHYFVHWQADLQV